MATIDTRKDSITEMSDERKMALISEIRDRRRNPPSEKDDEPEEQSQEDILEDLSPAQRQYLLNKLEDEDES